VNIVGIYYKRLKLLPDFHEIRYSIHFLNSLTKLLRYSTGAASVLTDRISQLQAETQDLREQNELLEFRILELEECHDNVSQTTAATYLDSSNEITC
jgi:hypothetical protein